MKIRSILTIAALTCAITLPALANEHGGDHDGGHYHHMMMMKHSPFDTMDLNHDGFISKSEMNKHFAEMDANHDGKISKEEWSGHMKKMTEQCHPKDHASDYKNMNE